MLNALPDRYLLEEFEWIIDGRGLQTLEEFAIGETPPSFLGRDPQIFVVDDGEHVLVLEMVQIR